MNIAYILPGEKYMTSDCLKNIDVAILAGGQGTRIRSVLGNTPKLLAPINGRPYIEHACEWLGRFGAKRLILCLGHFGEKVEQYLQSTALPFDIQISLEPEPMGTAGALRYGHSQLRSDPVLVMNGDSFVDADLCAFTDNHLHCGAPASLLCAEVLDTSRYGRVEVSPDGDIKKFVEKGKNAAGPGLVSAGVYLLGAPLIDEIASGSASSIEHDVFASGSAGRLHAYFGPFPFIDIGTPESFEEASRFMKRRE